MIQTLERRDKVIELRALNPTKTLKSIGLEVGVTTERVRQILKGEGLPTKAIHDKPIKQRKYHQGRQTIQLECCQCHILFTRYLEQHKRAMKHPGYTTKRTFCSKRCQGIYAGLHYGFRVYRENCGRKKKQLGMISRLLAAIQ